MLPTIGRTRFLGLALRSVLAQDPGVAAMQIEVVHNGDDRDLLQRFVCDLAGDRVEVFHQPAPVTMAENWNTCVRRSRGELVHLLNDDDEVLPGFYDAYSDAAGERASIVAGQAIEIDQDGRWIGISTPLAAHDGRVDDGEVALAKINVLRTPAVVVRRRTYEAVGGFLPHLEHATDWEMWARAAALGQVGWVSPPRALYRVHAGAATVSQVRTGRNIRDCLEVADLVSSRLQVRSQRVLVRTSARRSLGQSALVQATGAAAGGDMGAWLRNGVLALRLRPTARTLASLAVALLRGRRSGSDSL